MSCDNKLANKCARFGGKNASYITKQIILISKIKMCVYIWGVGKNPPRVWWEKIVIYIIIVSCFNFMIFKACNSSKELHTYPFDKT